MADSRIEKAVAWAEAIANDQSHGYSQGNTAENSDAYEGSRDGPDYDCSSLIYYALDYAGFPIISAWQKNPAFQSEYQGKQKVGDADTIYTDFYSIDKNIRKYQRSQVENNLQRGDILCDPDHHVGFYIGNGKTVEAKGVSYGSKETGDQGSEIDFFDASADWWTEVYRYEPGSAGGSGGGSGSSGGSVTPSQNNIPAPNIIEHTWGCNRGELGYPDKITIHNAAGWGTVDYINNFHAGNPNGVNFEGGIGYHFYINQNGEIHRGTPENMMGCHTGGYNSKNLGICLEGYYEDDGKQPNWDRAIPDAQWQSLVSLTAYLCNKYNISATRGAIKGHKEQPENDDTGCPGQVVMARMDELCKSVSGGSVVGGGKERTLWTEFMPLILKGLKKEGKTDLGRLDLFPKICYLYVQLMAAASNSSFNGAEWGFPFTNDLMQNYSGQKVYMTSPYGWRSSTGSFHEGIDMQPGGTVDAYDQDNPFCAVKDGVVVEAGDGGWADWNGITINHKDGTFSRYLHCKSIMVKTGDTVTKGQKIGTVGGYGPKGPEHYDYHLHMEFGRGDGSQSISSDPSSIGIDPMSVLRPTNADGPAWQLGS